MVWLATVIVAKKGRWVKKQILRYKEKDKPVIEIVGRILDPPAHQRCDWVKLAMLEGRSAESLKVELPPESSK